MIARWMRPHARPPQRARAWLGPRRPRRSGPRPRAGATSPPPADVTPWGRYLGGRGKLPVARLLPNGARRRGGVLTGSWHGWLVRPQQWLQPRVIPLIAAVVGLIAMLSAQSYLLALARGPEPTVEPAAPEASPAGPATQPPLAPPGLPERLPPSGR